MYTFSLRDKSGRSAGDVPVPVCCDLKGAHFVPPFVNIRHNAAAMMPFPVSDTVPNTAMLAQLLVLLPLVLRLAALGVGDLVLGFGCCFLRCGWDVFLVARDSSSGVLVDTMDGSIGSSLSLADLLVVL